MTGYCGHDGDADSEDRGGARHGQSTSDGLDLSPAIQKMKALHNTQNGSKQPDGWRHLDEEGKKSPVRLHRRVPVAFSEQMDSQNGPGSFKDDADK